MARNATPNNFKSDHHLITGASRGIVQGTTPTRTQWNFQLTRIFILRLVPVLYLYSASSGWAASQSHMCSVMPQFTVWRLSISWTFSLAANLIYYGIERDRKKKGQAGNVIQLEAVVSACRYVTVCTAHKNCCDSRYRPVARRTYD